MDDISHVVNNKNNKDKEIKEVKVEPQKKGTDVPSRKEDKNDGFKINKQNDNKKKNKKDGCC